MNEEIKNGSKSKACVSFLWTLVPLCFDPRVKWKKKVLKFGSQIAQEVCCKPEFHVASTSPASRESPLYQTRALQGTRSSYCTDTKRLAGSRNQLMV